MDIQISYTEPNFFGVPEDRFDRAILDELNGAERIKKAFRALSKDEQMTVHVFGSKVGYHSETYFWENHNDFLLDNLTRVVHIDYRKRDVQKIPRLKAREFALMLI